jgi:hypothetical protein
MRRTYYNHPSTAEPQHQPDLQIGKGWSASSSGWYLRWSRSQNQPQIKPQQNEGKPEETVNPEPQNTERSQEERGGQKKRPRLDLLPTHIDHSGKQ